MHSTSCTLPTGISIGDVARICGVQPHTIRYWEKEFTAFLAPGRTIGRQRRYRNDDITRLMEIKKLLWVHRFTIEGAKKLLNGDFAFAFASVGHDMSPAPQMELQGAA